MFDFYRVEALCTEDQTWLELISDGVCYTVDIKPRMIFTAVSPYPRPLPPTEDGCRQDWLRFKQE